jgi:hypothetical protein
LGSRRGASLVRIRAASGLDLLVELPRPKQHEHPLVLLLHQAPHQLHHVVAPQVFRVVSPRSAEDTATVGKKMGDQASPFDTRVLGLNVENAPAVPHVVVEAE